MQTAEHVADHTAERTRSSDAVVADDEVEDILALLGRQLGTSATVGAVFGAPQTRGERTVIPVARVAYGVGSGLNRGGARGAGTQPVAPDVRQRARAAFGFGGGGLRVEPLAVVEITAARVRIVPIVDVNRLVGRVFGTVFAFAFAALLVGALTARHPQQRSVRARARAWARSRRMPWQ